MITRSLKKNYTLDLYENSKGLTVSPIVQSQWEAGPLCRADHTQHCSIFRIWRVDCGNLHVSDANLFLPKNFSSMNSVSFQWRTEWPGRPALCLLRRTADSGIHMDIYSARGSELWLTTPSGILFQSQEVVRSSSQHWGKAFGWLGICAKQKV